MTFCIGEQVGTSHGPGRIVGIEKHEINGAKVDLYAIDLLKSRLLVPVDRADTLRPLSTLPVIADAMTVLGTRPKAPRGPWYSAALKISAEGTQRRLPHRRGRCARFASGWQR
jgi:RNA polymerase-interacting CarD/CdnL/TRCF family regulator